MIDREQLRRIPIFSSLNNDDLTQLSVLWKQSTKDAGQIVFKKGDPPEAMYVIRTGKISINTWTDDNQELFLTMLCDGDFFGELALLDGSPRTATAKVFERVELLEMRREVFIGFLQKNPGVCLSMMIVIAQRLRATNVLIEQQTTRNVNDEIEQQMTPADHLADTLSGFGGSWIFLGSVALVIAVWMAINTFFESSIRFDPFPFTFLSFLLATMVALQAPIIMMSQKRQAAKDRVRSEMDYQVGLKAEMQIQTLHKKLDELLMHELRELRETQREHSELLNRLHSQS
ncbi:MAG TPA: DUF1003 domain-containing protein [Bacteroidota bacterium]|nr:DUF1003 domain-containing protein [Bacteroidota bacterium]